MMAFDGVTWRAAVMGRWTALILGTLMVLLFLALVVGEGPPAFSSLTSVERLQSLSMGGLFLGLALSWKWEGLGGLLAVLGFVCLVAISRTHLHMWAFWVPAVIGAIHVACWGRLRAGMPAALLPWHLSRSIVLSLAALLTVFVLLCANEAFGEPPLMTYSLRPSAELSTAWQSTPADVLLAIHPDASVTGTVGTTTVTDARIVNNRSWFGRLLHWRYDYRIDGNLAGDKLIIRLETNGRNLDGWLWRVPPGSEHGPFHPLRITLRTP
jgi:hypothetical protein